MDLCLLCGEATPQTPMQSGPSVAPVPAVIGVIQPSRVTAGLGLSCAALITGAAREYGRPQVSLGRACKAWCADLDLYLGAIEGF